MVPVHNGYQGQVVFTSTQAGVRTVGQCQGTEYVLVLVLGQKVKDVWVLEVPVGLGNVG